MPRKKSADENDHDKVMSEMKELYEDKLKEHQALKNLLKAISQPVSATTNINDATKEKTESKQ